MGFEAILQKESDLTVIGLLLIIVLAVFSSALMFVPAQADDLVMLSSAARTGNPLTYFVGDWGLGNNAYRPLHSLSIWLGYHAFDISAFPNQLFNLLLHFINACLLFFIIHTLQHDRVVAFLLTTLFLVSFYTVSPATYVSDRPSLLVGLCTLLLVKHLVVHQRGEPWISVPYIAVLSILALLSKESGLLVPLFAIVAVLQLNVSRRVRVAVICACLAILMCYATMRFILFGANAASYTESGYLFGLSFYADRNAFSGFMRVIALVDTVVRNLIAPFVPMFDSTGEIIGLADLPWRLFLIIPTICLACLAASRKISMVQRGMLVIILLNSVLHFAEFRDRVQYVAQIALCVFVAGSEFPLRSVKHSVAYKTLGSVLLIFNTFFIGRYLGGEMIRKYEELNTYRLARVVNGYIAETRGRGAPIDSMIVDRVLKRYNRPVE